jgi:hypothetical protein
VDIVNLAKFFESLHQLPLAAIFAVLVAFIFIATGLYYFMRRPEGASAKGERSLTAQLAASTAPASPAAPAAGTAPGAPPLLRIDVDASGRMAVEVDGRRYAGLLDVPEPRRAAVVQAIDAAVQFGLAKGAPPAAEPPAAPPAERPKLDVSERPITAKPLLPEDYEAARKRHERIGRISAVASALVPEPEAPSTPAFFVIINEIIARRIQENPALHGRHVELRTNLSGDLEVVDGNQVFPSIDEVADNTLRNLIRAAIAEWEKQ